MPTAWTARRAQQEDKQMAFRTKYLLITLAAFSPSLQADETTRYDTHVQGTLEYESIDDVPEIYRRAYPDAYSYKLESVPDNWVTQGELAVSDKHCKAGKRSVRWRYKSPQSLLMKDIRGANWTKAREGGEESCFSFSALQEKPLKDAQLHIWVHGENGRVFRVIRSLDFTNWYQMAADVGYLNRDKNPDPLSAEEGVRNYNANALAEGRAFCVTKERDLIPKAILHSPNSILLLAPEGVASGELYLDRLYTNVHRVELRADRINAWHLFQDLEGDDYEIGCHGFESWLAANIKKPAPKTEITQEEQDAVAYLRNTLMPKEKPTAESLAKAKAEAKRILDNELRKDTRLQHQQRQDRSFPLGALMSAKIAHSVT